MKDNFSKDSQLYAKYRPTYPAVVFDYIFSLIENKNVAWDCATGNGQVATKLAKKFTLVKATDLSASQLKNSTPLNNIDYSVQLAEKTNFKNHQFDLITVSQAIHWFNFNEFYAEVNRTLKPNGYLVVIGYGLASVTPKINNLINYFYNDILGKYWDDERKYIEENYQTIPFPFKEVAAPKFKITYCWAAEDFLNYLYTWSAVKHFISIKKRNPLKLIEHELKNYWEDKKREVTFPVLLRVGNKKSFSA